MSAPLEFAPDPAATLWDRTFATRRSRGRLGAPASVRVTAPENRSEAGSAEIAVEERRLRSELAFLARVKRSSGARS